MTAYPATIGTAPMRDAQGRVFRPNGKILKFGLMPNPIEDTFEETHAARLFVGFKVGNKVTWKIGDLVKLVRQFQRDHGRQEDGTFLAQTGVFTHTKGPHKGKVVVEPGGQAVLINMSDLKFEGFRAEMIQLAELICRKFRQEKVVLEMQRNGVVAVTYGIIP